MASASLIPTRMELTRLKKKVVTARRGHKLLKDKRDGLMKFFMETVRDLGALREEVEAELSAIQRSMEEAEAVMGRSAVEVALSYPSVRTTLTVEEKNVMSVRVPVYGLTTEGTGLPYGHADTSVHLDKVVEGMEALLPKLLRLAEGERQVELLAGEIEKTRRRCNALEYKVIPETEEAIRYITMKLSEQERSNVVRLMKVKELVLSDAIAARREATERAAHPTP